MANTTGQKFGGRTKGTPNKCTSKTKELLSEAIGGEADRILEALSEVFESNKKDYLLIMAPPTLHHPQSHRSTYKRAC